MLHRRSKTGVTLAVLALAVVVGCSDETEDNSSSSNTTSTSASGGSGGAGGATSTGGSGGSGGQAMMVPACGPASNTWVDPQSGFNGGGADIGTPQTAWQVGTATQATPYVQANLGSSGSAFFVFCAGPALTNINIALNDVNGMGFDLIHIHEGANMAFGAEVPADTTSAVGGQWTLTPGETYVLEVVGTSGAFF